MSIRVALHHLTRYDYDRPVTLGPQVVRLRPAPHCRTNILDYTLRVKPEKHFVNWQQDPQGNYLARLVFEQPTRHLVVEVNLIAEMVASNPFDFFLEPGAEKVPFRYDPGLASELEPFLRLQPQGKLFQALLPEVRSPAGTRTNDFIVDINQKVQKLIKYVVTLLAALRGGSSRRDFGVSGVSPRAGPSEHGRGVSRALGSPERVSRAPAVSKRPSGGVECSRSSSLPGPNE
jgi:transglutaminase-like putative cysteine protease